MPKAKAKGMRADLDLRIAAKAAEVLSSTGRNCYREYQGRELELLKQLRQAWFGPHTPEKAAAQPTKLAVKLQCRNCGNDKFVDNCCTKCGRWTTYQEALAAARDTHSKPADPSQSFASMTDSLLTDVALILDCDKPAQDRIDLLCCTLKDALYLVRRLAVWTDADKGGA